MTEQERPRTEAGRTTLRVIRDVLDAVDEHAKAFGVDGPDPLDPLPLILAIEAEARRDGSESPPHEGGPLCIDCDKPFQHLGDASESPLPTEDIAGDLWHQREGWHSMGDASESGQPPEASDE